MSLIDACRLDPGVIGNYLRLAGKAQPDPRGARRRDLLPLPLPEQGSFQQVENMYRSGRALDQDTELVMKGCCEGVAGAIVSGLNFEAMGRAGGPPLAWPRVASQGQRAALALICEAAAYFCREPLAKLEDFDWSQVVKAKGMSYDGQEMQRGSPLVLGELMPGLPAAGLAE